MNIHKYPVHMNICIHQKIHHISSFSPKKHLISHEHPFKCHASPPRKRLQELMLPLLPRCMEVASNLQPSWSLRVLRRPWGKVEELVWCVFFFSFLFCWGLLLDLKHWAKNMHESLSFFRNRFIYLFFYLFIYLFIYIGEIYIYIFIEIYGNIMILVSQDFVWTFLFLVNVWFLSSFCGLRVSACQVTDMAISGHFWFQKIGDTIYHLSTTIHIMHSPKFRTTSFQHLQI